MTARQRDDAYLVITEAALAYSTGWTSPAEIDRIGIVPSTRLAMRRALSRLSPRADCLLIDALSLRAINLPQKSIIRGDSKSLSIAAASIIAKVERDRLMSRLAKEHPDYGFESHKGYGTQRHLAAIRLHGPCSEHRMSFRPLNRAPPTRGFKSSKTEVGRSAESFAATALEGRGMTVIGRNFSTRFGEVDLVALAGETLVFVEVRARRSRAFVTPAETVMGEKSRRLIVACQQFLQDTDVPWRTGVSTSPQLSSTGGNAPRRWNSSSPPSRSEFDLESSPRCPPSRRNGQRTLVPLSNHTQHTCAASKLQCRR